MYMYVFSYMFHLLNVALWFNCLFALILLSLGRIEACLVE